MVDVLVSSPDQQKIADFRSLQPSHFLILNPRLIRNEHVRTNISGNRE